MREKRIQGIKTWPDISRFYVSRIRGPTLRIIRSASEPPQINSSNLCITRTTSEQLPPDISIPRLNYFHADP